MERHNEICIKCKHATRDKKNCNIIHSRAFFKYIGERLQDELKAKYKFDNNEIPDKCKYKLEHAVLGQNE